MTAHAFLLFALLFGIPGCVFAKQETVWNFQKGIPGAWHISGCLSAKQTSNGFHIIAGKERCQIQRNTADIRHPIVTLSLETLSSTPIDIIFLWHRRNTPLNHMVELPITLTTRTDPQISHLNLPAYSQWDSSTDRIGFSLPPNAAFTLQNLTFTQWSLTEKILAILQSFWTFDAFRPYTINFLWGPIIGFNPVWQDQLFTQIPPRGWSGNRIFAWLLLPFGFSLFWHWHRKRSLAHSRTLLLFCSFVIVSWIALDVRMGLEILSYVRSDWQSYVVRSPGERTFRVFENFPDIVDRVLPFLTSAERYGFAGPVGTPFGSYLRYRTYPTILVDAERPKEEREDIRHWLILLRPEAAIGEQGELLLGKEQLSPPGAIIQNFESNAILFEVTDTAATSPQDEKDGKDSKDKKGMKDTVKK